MLASVSAVVLAQAAPIVAQEGAGEGALAQDPQSYAFAIAAKPLPQAIADFAAVTGLQVLYTEQATFDHVAPALNGTFTASEALRRLLAGSGLVWRYTAAGAITVEAPTVEGSAVALDPVLVEGQGGLGSGTTEGTGSYTTGSMSTATRLDLSPRETPQSVSVVTQQQIEDQGLVTLEEALGQTTGITTRSYGRENLYFYSRGYQVDKIQYDGLYQDHNVWTYNNPDLAMYDRIEVLRGAAGLLQGAGSPAGSINLVRKRPTDVFQVSGVASVGSWNTYRMEGDVAGPLVEDGGLRGRLVASFEDGDYFTDVVEHQRSMIYGVVDVEMPSGTMLTIGASRQQTDTLPDTYGMPTYTDGTLIDLPRDTYLGTDWNRFDFLSTTLFTDLEHEFESDWSLNISAAMTWTESEVKQASAQGAVNPATGLGATLSGFAVHEMWEQNQFAFDAYVSGPVTAFAREHELVFGAAVQRRSFDIDFGLLSGLGQPVDVFNWDPSSVPEPPDPAITFSSDSITTEWGGYAAGRFSVADPLTVILGGRFSWYRSDQFAFNPVTGATLTDTGFSADGEFVPYAGVVWDLDETFSVYASYTGIFNPQSELDASGVILPPVRGTNYEVGIKAEFFDGGLNASLAAFRTDETDRAAVDTGATCLVGTVCYRAAGEVRSEGFEAELSGEVLDGWNLFAGYTFNVNEYIDDPQNQGRAFQPFTPRHMFRLSTNYELPGALDGWSVGGNLTAQSGTYVWDGNFRIEQDAYAVVGLNVGYEISENFSAALTVNNVLDETYYSGLRRRSSTNFYGEPRNAMLTLRAEW